MDSNNSWLMQEELVFDQNLQIQSVEATLKAEDQQDNKLSRTETPFPPPTQQSTGSGSVFNCTGCLFLTTSAHRHEEHIALGNHFTTPRSISCPGCTNSFHHRSSLEAHLLNDHHMQADEAAELADSLQSQLTDVQPTNKQKEATKSRIFIKSVDVLRNPSFAIETSIAERDESPATDQTLIDLCNEDVQQQQQRQKIYLKNVNELQEQQQQQSHLFQPEFQTMTFQTPLPYSIAPPPPPTLINDLELPSMDLSSRVLLQPAEEPQLPQKNKIYIRNVQTLIRPDVHEQETTATYLQLRHEINLLNMEEVESLPPQRNDIVILDDFHEEFFHPQRIEQQEAPDVEEIELVDYVSSSDRLKVAEGLSFIADSAECESVDEFHYKNLEENISQLILSTTTGGEAVQPCRIETPDSVLQINEIETSPVICLPDESDNEELNANTSFVLPQMPRIYVSNNLTELPDDTTATPSSRSSTTTSDINVVATGAALKKGRGRPRGGRNYAKKGANFRFSCPEPDCARRFHLESNLDYHKRCHDPVTKEIICPECDEKGMNKWNILHTHLWRRHKIDMELYACTVCAFKTPCLSSLNNIHAKTHSEEKSFKCEICGAAFKNQKQCKNHRRNHRLSAQKVPTNGGSAVKFSIVETEKPAPVQEKEKAKSRLKVTKKAVQVGAPDDLDKKMFRCDLCPYATIYRNSARRHRMAHAGEKKYKCSFCEYSCIQSNSFRSHLLKSHPDEAHTLIFNCPKCTFTTINKGQFTLHGTKHNGEAFDVPKEVEEDRR